MSQEIYKESTDELRQEYKTRKSYLPLFAYRLLCLMVAETVAFFRMLPTKFLQKK